MAYLISYRQNTFRDHVHHPRMKWILTTYFIIKWQNYTDYDFVTRINITILSVMVSQWQVKHLATPRDEAERCGEIHMSLVSSQWPKSTYQFLFYDDNTKLMNISKCSPGKCSYKVVLVSFEQFFNKLDLTKFLVNGDSSNGNIFRVTGLPLTKASDKELRWFLWSAPEQTVEQTIETPVIWDPMVLIMSSL